MSELAQKQNTTLGIQELERAAEYVVKSRLFGVDRKEQAVALMLLAQAEGLHPMRAIQEYHIIQGRPAMRADAMLARFLQAGGKVTWHKLTDTEVSATFEHPQGGKVTITWTWDMAKRAGLTEKKNRDGSPNNWQKYPRQMLRSRVVSEGVRTVFPGVATGIYTPEEVADFEPAKPVQVEAEVIEAEVVEPRSELAQRGPERITPAQLKKLKALLRDLGLDNGAREVALKLAAVIIGREVGSSKELTKEEASKLIDRLERLKGVLVTAGAKSAQEMGLYLRYVVENGLSLPETDEEAYVDLQAFREERQSEVAQELIPEEEG